MKFCAKFMQSFFFKCFKTLLYKWKAVYFVTTSYHILLLVSLFIVYCVYLQNVKFAL